LKKILHVFDMPVAKEKIFAALTTQQGLSGWWAKDVSIENGSVTIIKFHFDGDFNPNMEVTVAEPNQTVKWKCIAGHDNWLSNMFSFSLKDHGAKTRLTFTQDYARELSDDDYGIYNFNWGYYLESLRLYCETGVGKPYRPEAG